MRRHRCFKGTATWGNRQTVMEMMKKVGNPKRAENWLRNAFKNKSLVMGFGHRVYKQGDSRVPTMKNCLRDLTEWAGDTKWLEIYEIMENIMVNEKNIYPNLDFPSQPSLLPNGFPIINLYTPIFVMAQITGWSAHYFEQNTDNSLIRPLSQYTGKQQRKVKPLSKRK